MLGPHDGSQIRAEAQDRHKGRSRAIQALPRSRAGARGGRNRRGRAACLQESRKHKQKEEPLMAGFWQFASLLKEQINATAWRSDVLKPLAWLIAMLITLTVMLTFARAPEW